jgi:hypothetical protein
MLYVKVVDSLNDFTDGSSRAQQLDSKILQGVAYLWITRRSGFSCDGTGIRQHLTDSRNFNESDVMALMKNVGGSKTE